MWHGAKVATHQDLSGLFLVRAVEQYLRPEGRFGFVMPEAVLSRLAYAGFRRGDWSSPLAHTTVAFGRAWSFGRIKPPIFRVPSCVVSGIVRASSSPMPATFVQWRGRRPASNVSWEAALDRISETDSDIVVAGDRVASPYHGAFSQGATVVPRVLLVVEDAPAIGILGTPAGLRRVTSRRDSQEKAPWKHLPGLTYTVERMFLHPLHLGKTVVPFRCLEPMLAILPWDGQKLLSGEDPDLARYPGLQSWWRHAERLWNQNRTQRTPDIGRAPRLPARVVQATSPR